MESVHSALVFNLVDQDAASDDLAALTSLNAETAGQDMRAVIVLYLKVRVSIVVLLAEMAGDREVNFICEYMHLIVPVAAG